MKSAREHILQSIAQHRGGPLTAEARGAISARIGAHGANTIPARGQIDAAARLELFTRMALAAGATVANISGRANAPQAIAEYLRANNLPAELRLSPDPLLLDLPWQEAANVAISSGPARPQDEVSVTPALAGVAETGTLMLASGAQQPTTLNFLPDVHIALLDARDIVGAYEQAFDRLRAAAGAKAWPRTVNLITGPSRTADIEQTVVMGAHGPRRLHILIIGDGA